MTTSATGGAAGNASTGTGGHGGSANASDTVTGVAAVTVSANAYGANAGTGSVSAGAGSSGIASVTGIAGTGANVSASGHGGSGVGSSVGTASATATGKSGGASATADSHLVAGSLVRDTSASASVALYGNSLNLSTVSAVANTSIGVAITAMDTTSQSVSHIAGNPTNANVTAILAANSNIQAAFATASPSYFGIGELGARHSSISPSTETTSQSFNLVVDLNQLAVKEHLLIGFYGGQSFGTGVSSVTLTISANGTTLINQTFGSASAAVTYFTNHAVDLGTLTAPLYSSNTLNLTANLTVTTSSVGSGFYGNLLIGDPPALASDAKAVVQGDTLHFPAPTPGPVDPHPHDLPTLHHAVSDFGAIDLGTASGEEAVFHLAHFAAIPDAAFHHLFI